MNKLNKFFFAFAGLIVGVILTINTSNISAHNEDVLQKQIDDLLKQIKNLEGKQNSLENKINDIEMHQHLKFPIWENVSIEHIKDEIEEIEEGRIKVSSTQEKSLYTAPVNWDERFFSPVPPSRGALRIETHKDKIFTVEFLYEVKDIVLHLDSLNSDLIIENQVDALEVKKGNLTIENQTIKIPTTGGIGSVQLKGTYKKISFKSAKTNNHYFRMQISYMPY